MRIRSLNVRNYRTLEDIELRFPAFYTAICGKNDSGKTNVVRVVRHMLPERGPFVYMRDEDISLKDDFTQWRDEASDKRSLLVNICFEIHKDRDAGLFHFITDYLNLPPDTEDNLSLNLLATYSGENPTGKVSVTAGGKEFNGLKAEEVLKKLQSSTVVLFHNSTEPKHPYFRSSRFSGTLEDLSQEYEEQVEAIKDLVNDRMKHIAQRHQKQIEELLGRLGSQYKVALSVPAYDFDYLPYNITLGDTKVDIALGEWGSGTQNRTLILLTLFRARRVSESGTSASKITPIIIVEEPESFLHPAAQAQFGRVLQDLSEEFEVQVIVTTHSPYMLSLSNPEANILLERYAEQGQLRGTYKVDTSGDNWMEPFGLVLGIRSSEFQPWEKLFFAGTRRLLLVEGDTDKEYFELLRAPAHSSGQLVFDGEVFAYNGRDNLKSASLLSFIRNRYEKVFITYDLDADADLSSYLDRQGFERNDNYCPVGRDMPGRKNIEGLVPEKVTQVVYASFPALVDRAMSGDSGDRRSARQELKRLILEEFKAQAQPGNDYYGGFYEITRVINRALA